MKHSQSTMKIKRTMKSIKKENIKKENSFVYVKKRYLALRKYGIMIR